VRLTVFKTDAGRIPSLVSSILIYLRHSNEPVPFLGWALSYSVIDECMIICCQGESDCRTCIETIYLPILNQLEDTQCTGLVIDKRGILCSRERKSLSLVAETILLYKNRSPLRKMAIVTSIEYSKDEELLRNILFEKGLNLRLFTDLEEATVWAQSYP